MADKPDNVTPFPGTRAGAARLAARPRRARPIARPSARLSGLATLGGAGLFGVPSALYVGGALGYLTARYASRAERSSDWWIAAALLAAGWL